MSEENIQLDQQQVIAGLAAALLPHLQGGYKDYYNSFRNATADNPATYPAGPQYEDYTNAMVDRINEFEPGYTADKIDIVSPQVARTLGIDQHSSMASNTRVPAARVKDFHGKENIVSMNPYHDREALAHELGHTVTQRTKLGNAVHQAKTFMRRPGEGLSLKGLQKIAQETEGKSIGDKARAVLRAPGGPRQAALLATMLAPAIGSALTPGSDDTALALGLAYAMNAPTLLDEAFANAEGLGIMKRAGTPATRGQRMRNAGRLLAYAMPATITGLAANAAGNFFDENV